METERLLLRRFTQDDLDKLVELNSDPDVMRFINGGRLGSEPTLTLRRGLAWSAIGTIRSCS